MMDRSSASPLAHPTCPTAAMNLHDAIASRRSVRDFLDTPVPEAVIRRVLEHALRAPSGGNLQPWHLHVLTGAPLADFKARMQQRLQDEAAGSAAPEPGEYSVYPPVLGPLPADRGPDPEAAPRAHAVRRHGHRLRQPRAPGEPTANGALALVRGGRVHRLLSQHRRRSPPLGPPPTQAVGRRWSLNCSRNSSSAVCRWRCAAGP